VRCRDSWMSSGPRTPRLVTPRPLSVGSWISVVWLLFRSRWAHFSKVYPFRPKTHGKHSTRLAAKPLAMVLSNLAMHFDVQRSSHAEGLS